MESQYDKQRPSLDFLSPDFDPVEALNCEGLEPPNPRVRPLDNLNKCRRILPQEVPESIANVPVKQPRSAESIAAQQRAKARHSLLLEKAAEQARKVKILDQIAEKVRKGPLGLLANCYDQRGRLQVWTRHAHGARGTLIGFLVAFDKHMNMVLNDVDEDYSVRLHVARMVKSRKSKQVSNVDAKDLPQQFEESSRDASTIEHLSNELKELRLFPKLEYRRRHLNQVFLRGDSIILVRRL